jgi:uncharacterized protein
VGTIYVMQPSALSRRSPLRFFRLTVALAVPFWLLGALVKPPEDWPVQLPLSALQFIRPLLAASLLVGGEDRLAGLGHLLARVLSYRGITPAWWVTLVLLMPLIYLLAYGVQRLLGRPLPALEIALPTVLSLGVLFFITAVAEEAGWMGYAYDPLEARWGALRAAILLSVVWAIFHLVADLQGAHDLDWIAWHRIGTVATRVLIVWAYNNTERSILAAALLHATANIGWQLTPVSGSRYDPAVTALITAVVATVVTFLWGPKTLARYRYTS